MWPRFLSWVALVCNVLAVLINCVFMYAMFESGQKSLVNVIIILVVGGGVFLSGPILTIFALLFGAPLVRRANVPAVASAFD